MGDFMVKSFRRAIAILLSVLLIFISVPFTNKANAEIEVNPAPEEGVLAHLGLEKYYKTQLHSVGDQTAEVNLQWKNVIIQDEDVALFTEGLLPYSLKRTFNNNNTGSVNESIFGKGWTYAGNETLVKKSDSCIYIDPDGSVRTFSYNTTN
jgi:hypothetical protein